MSKALKVTNNNLQKRRDFLSRTSKIGGMAVLSASVGPAQAARSLTGSSSGAIPDIRSLSIGCTSVEDFSGLVGKQFNLPTKGGDIASAKLIETSSPITRRALRFRHEQYSIVFDVPDNIELEHGNYRITHP